MTDDLPSKTPREEGTLWVTGDLPSRAPQEQGILWMTMARR